MLLTPEIPQRPRPPPPLDANEIRRDLRGRDGVGRFVV
jgi:hypothetical protein